MSTSERHLVLDSTNTVITATVRWFGVVPVTVAFPRLHGGLELGEECLTRSSLRVDVEAGSASTGIGLRDRHLRGARFLFADLHPFVSFRSASARREGGQLIVVGTLSLRGHEAIVAATCPVDDLSTGGTTVDLCGAFTISRAQFDVGRPRGLAGRNPLFLAIADAVDVRVRIRVPVAAVRPALPVAAPR